jgi:ribonuclease Z
VGRAGYEIIPFATSHRGVNALGYSLVEEERRGRFNPELARELGIPEGPLWGQIHKGQTITLDDGRIIHPELVVGPTRAGRKVVLSGDTLPSETTVEHARDADLLVHEATFGDEEAARAAETGHSTAREAARVAQRAGVKQLALTHFSARYSRDTSELVREAREVYDNVMAARDGTSIEVHLADEKSHARAG